MFTIDEIIEATQGSLIQGPETQRIISVSIDSRMARQHEMFIAVKGDVFDGHDFIKDVLSKGVKVIVVHRPVAVSDQKVSVIMVKDTTKALGHLARFHRLRYKIPVLALTGSAGKTTTKEMLAAVFAKKYAVLKNEGTQNNHIGVPLTLLKLTSHHQIIVLECGTNQPGDIPWLADITRPTHVLFTNIGESHLEKLKTPQGVLREKWSLTQWLDKTSTVIINQDDQLLSSKVKGRQPFKVETFSINKSSRYKADRINIKQGRLLSFHLGSKIIELNTCGINNVYNALAAYTCGRLMSVPEKKIIQALKSFQFPKGRGQILNLGSGWLINDSYNANPVSMRCAISTLQALKASGKKIMVSADMMELGHKSKDLHKELGTVVAQAQIQVLITVGALSRHLAAQARKKNKQMQVFACADIESAQKRLAAIFHNGDSVLVKGSRRMAMERVVDFLLMSPDSSIPK